MNTNSEIALFKAINENNDSYFIDNFNNQFVDKFACNQSGTSFLGNAIEKNSMNIIKFLLNDEELIKYIDKRGFPPVAYLARNPNKEIIQMFKDANADFNQSFLGDRNILHIVAIKDDIETFNRLVTLGADPNKKSENGETPFDTAKRYRNISFMSQDAYQKNI